MMLQVMDMEAGGGSYNSGSNQSNTVGNTGHGKVIINKIS